MGALAKWGAIAGAAKGYAEGKQQEWDAESEAESARIDDQRKQAFERLQQEGRMELERLKQEGATGRTEMTVTGQQDVQEMRGEQAADERIWKSEENEMDRANAREIAQIRADATRSGSGASNPIIKANLDRYQARTLTREEANQYGIALTSTEEPAIFDNMTGTWYLQEGDKLFFAQDAERTVKARANQNHLEALYANPQRATEFYDKFGYLPRGYLQALMASDMRISLSGAQSEPGAQ